MAFATRPASTGACPQQPSEFVESTRGRSPRRLQSGEFVSGDGNFYAVNVTEDLGVEDSGGLVRIGLSHYNTSEEVDILLDALQSLRP